jgi:hypothetical protein
MVAVRAGAEPVEASVGLPAPDAPPGRLWPSRPEYHATRRRSPLASPPVQAVAGVVLLVQEGRLRLLTDDGRCRVFLLSHAAAIEPQDLALLPGRRVRLWHHASPKLMAGTITDIEILA